MHHQTTPQPADTGELLIDRMITFRNSTFGTLKAYIRRHKKRTGIELTNSAALDLLLRDELLRVLPSAATRELRTLTPSATFFALQSVEWEDSDRAPRGVPAGRRGDEEATAAPTPADAAPTPYRGSCIAVEMPKRGPRGAA